MRYTKTLQIQDTLEFLSNKILSKEISYRDQAVFLAWFTDRVDYPTTQTEVGKRIGVCQAETSKSFTKLLKAGCLVKTKFSKIGPHTVPHYCPGPQLVDFINKNKERRKDRTLCKQIQAWGNPMEVACENPILHKENKSKQGVSGVFSPTEQELWEQIKLENGIDF